jgi:hypothetical protein
MNWVLYIWQFLNEQCISYLRDKINTNYGTKILSH